MIYEARQSTRVNYLLAGACLLLSVLGFAAAGVIPTQSGSYPLVGWTIVAACFGAAFVFLRRARGGGVEARIDGNGIFVPAHSAETIPWGQITGVLPIRAGIQRIVRFALRDPERYAAAGAMRRTAGAVDAGLGFGHFGINTTFYDRGMDDLLATVRHHRPDLFDGPSRR
ncbi:MAG TPA: hypothetical protein VMS43_04760 [Allosphingosinicella sp.]|nr:hypothetical protein [Allosphingosinicella sp.]